MGKQFVWNSADTLPRWQASTYCFLPAGSGSGFSYKNVNACSIIFCKAFAQLACWKRQTYAQKIFYTQCVTIFPRLRWEKKAVLHSAFCADEPSPVFPFSLNLNSICPQNPIRNVMYCSCFCLMKSIFFLFRKALRKIYRTSHTKARLPSSRTPLNRHSTSVSKTLRTRRSRPGSTRAVTCCICTTSPLFVLSWE